MKTALAIALALAAFASPARAAPDLAADAEVMRANARVDQAEHALALARRNTWSTRDGVVLQPSRRSIADIQRIEFYRRDVIWARHALVGLLQQRRLEQVAEVTEQTQQTQTQSQQRIKVASLEWVPYVPPR